MAELVADIASQREYIEYVKNVTHKHSPAVQKIINLYTSYIEDAEKSILEGKKAVWTAGISEAPLLYSLGVTPVAFTELGRLGNKGATSIAEDNFQLPRETCSMVKTLLGEYYMRRETPIKKIILLANGCEPMKMLYDVIEKYGYEIKTLDAGFNVKVDDPNRYEHLITHYINEAQELSVWLTGHEIDEDKLGEEMRRYNRIMKKAKYFLELKKQHPAYILSLPTMVTVIGSGHYFGKPDQYEEALDELINELESLGENEYIGDWVPLLWSGGRGQEFGVYQAIDEAGGSILGWGSIPQIYTLFDEEKPPLRAFAEYQMGGPMSGSTAAMYPFMESEIERSGAKGIFQYGYVGCSFAGIDGELKRKHFQEKGIPTMEILGSFQVGPPSGQLITRVKAFIEMLA